MGFSTDAIHAGQEVDATTGAVSVPIYQTSTYKLVELGVTTGYDYARTINPTRSALERSMAALEKGQRGLRLRLRDGRDQRHLLDALVGRSRGRSPTTSTAAPSASSTAS